jgi:xanthine dehydrogenase accessory factor
MSHLSERITELVAQRRPFVHATVVRAQEPTSARPGDAAIILEDGSVEGFVGGQCAEGSVRAAALGVLEDGETLLLRVLPTDSTPFPESPGAQVVVNPCQSGGALEIFLKPMLPPPLLRVLGATPITDAVATLATFLGFTVEREPSGSRPEGAVAVIVASLGRAEEESIRSAVDAGVGFVGLVASKRRGGEVLDRMQLSEAERARVRTPAGIGIGARTPPEVALSVLSEVVRAIRVDGLAPPQSAPVPLRPRQAVDPVCGMTVTVVADTPHLLVGHDTYWFCRPGCRDDFAGRQTTAAAAARAGGAGTEGG